jgi:hypothetical protein
VSEFDATSGATIKFHLRNDDTQAMLVDGHNHLFLANTSSIFPDVHELDATTGAIINDTFVSGFTPFGLALDDNNHLFVGNGNGVAEYNATTGAVIKANFITGLNGDWSIAYVPAVVPEPSTFALATLGLAGLAALASRRRVSGSFRSATTALGNGTQRVAVATVFLASPGDVALDVHRF